MGLPWVRLDTNIASHDKILALLGTDQSTDLGTDLGSGPAAAWTYICGLAYSGGHGTDGLIPFAALPFVHGTKHLAGLLVEHGLWVPDPAGWRIPNWADRQQISLATEAKRAAQSAGAAKGNCIRWHGPNCGCWQATDSVDRVGNRVAQASRSSESHERTNGRTDGEGSTSRSLSHLPQRARTRETGR